MEMKGENCAIAKAAEKNPKSLKAPFRRWYSKTCPGWKAYQQHLAQKHQGLGILKAEFHPGDISQLGLDSLIITVNIKPAIIKPASTSVA